MKQEFGKYLSKRAHLRPVSGPELALRQLRQAVVIPAFAESEFLPRTLQSLADNDPELRRGTLVLVVVNNTAARPGTNMHAERQRAAAADNRRTLAWLADAAPTLPLNLAWIDAASDGRELPHPGGVGMARKIGCDTAISLLADGRDDAPRAADAGDVVLLCLDADTLVLPDYLAVARELLESGRAGGTIPYQHQRADSPEAQRAISSYELYMHTYVAGLRSAQSPYAFHTVGSAMLCTATGYVKAGGMPAKRQAGEDFYFLQQLAKTGGVQELTGTTVFPSPRVSTRVPFGTGPRMAQALEEPSADFLAHAPQTFAALAQFLSVVRENFAAPPLDILARLDCGETAEFVLGKGVERVLPRLRRQHGTGEPGLRAFHQWFDGLATFRLINHLTQTRWPQRPLLETAGELLVSMGQPIPPTASAAALLEAYRRLDERRRSQHHGSN